MALTHKFFVLLLIAAVACSCNKELKPWTDEATDTTSVQPPVDTTASTSLPASPPPISDTASLLDTILLEYPSTYQVYQRTGSRGHIRIKGRVVKRGGPVDIEARFNKGKWTKIAGSVGETFSGILADQPQGQGPVELRIVGDSVKSVSVNFVGVGDVYIIAGQSNASGRLQNPQRYYHPTIKAALFGNDYSWKELTDPTDSNKGQVDKVSRENGQAGYSYWPLLATYMLQDQSFPIAFVPAAKGGSEIRDWLPKTNHLDRSTLYGSMMNRVKTVFGVKAILWHQGETDAYSNPNLRYLEQSYRILLEKLADAISADLRVKLIAAKIHYWYGSNSSIGNIELINRAIEKATAENENVILGPDFHQPTDITHSLHFTTNAEAEDAALRWWSVLKTIK